MTLAAGLAACALAACGYKGGLRLPDHEPAPVAAVPLSLASATVIA